MKLISGWAFLFSLNDKLSVGVIFVLIFIVDSLKIVLYEKNTYTLFSVDCR